MILAVEPFVFTGIATVVAATVTGGGIFLWKSTNFQIKANATLATAQANKTDEEREGVATSNAKMLITLMEDVMGKQNLRFEQEVGRMQVQTEHMNQVSLRDSKTIADLRKLLEEQRYEHEKAMTEERKRCDRAMEELHLRIDLLSKRVDVNSNRLETNAKVISALEHSGPIEASLLDTPVIITRLEHE